MKTRKHFKTRGVVLSGLMLTLFFQDSLNCLHHWLSHMVIEQHCGHSGCTDQTHQDSHESTRVPRPCPGPTQCDHHDQDHQTLTFVSFKTHLHTLVLSPELVAEAAWYPMGGGLNELVASLPPRPPPELNRTVVRLI